MKRLLFIAILFVNCLPFTNAQDRSFWPDEVALIPGMGVEIFNIDKSHSNMIFSIGFFGFSDVKGTFDRFGGTILYNENDLGKTSVSLVMDASSINTNSGTRDKDLKKENFFDTENHRFIRFKSNTVKKKGKRLMVTGELTIKGVTKEISFPLERTQKRFIDPFWSNLNIGFKGELTLDRMDFDVHGGRWGEKVLSKEVKIQFEIVGQQPNTFKWGSGEVSTKMTEVVGTVLGQGIEAGKTKFNEVAESMEVDGRSAGVVVKRLIQKNNFTEAIGFAEFVLEKFPNEAPRVYRDMAKAYLFLGDMEKAKAMYTEIGSKNPLDTEAIEVLAKMN